MRAHLGPIGAVSALVAAASLLAGSLAAPAEAAGKAQAKREARAKAVAPRNRQQASQPIETMDDIRANSQDPAGNYKAFPSWARSAFTNFPRD